MTLTLAKLGEAELLRRLACFAPPGQLADDTCTLAADTRQLLVNTDVLVEDIHFSDRTTSPEDVGWRAVATNLSDLAASGAIAVDGITVALVAPGNTHWSWVEDLYRGINEALSCFGGILLGGDCSAGSQRLISVTALGRVGPLRLHRADACPGDWLVTSGAHGLSRLGLALLQGDPALDENETLTVGLRDLAISRHQRPIPRLDALNTLLDQKPKDMPWRAAGTDSSDGLLAAVQALCSSSHCGAQLTREWLPKSTDWPSGSRWDEWCLNGGEDFELVLSLPPAWAQRWIDHQPGSHRIGSITGDSNAIVWSDTRRPVAAAGFDHFGSSLNDA
ncbi:thiamine-monophosphate kinase [Synechococcus sp. BIOS-E4-1]|uniref:thiamine-phosphate kinase n=1 Tax=Synechococcus sp. BIOS-E4-1 TaxID=1400864 RepID=UPI001646015F|nr:thiamine-phosphate kinase [Synechococcus sp. BIOS-E4-1]QNI52616.1 thiamine-monophosphate kinase [Synechococcus sp. BIOS-E4-1]